MIKSPTSIRLNAENKAKLEALSKRDGLPISQIINKMISEYSSKSSSSHQSPEFEKRLSLLESEVSVQRQRINILKNQIDFILKPQDGRNKYIKYQRDNKSKQSLESEQKGLGLE